MTLRNLSNGAMITNTRYFIGALRADLDRHPTLSWALPLLEVILDDLVAVERDPRAELEVARQTATASDASFDDYTRGLYWLCKGIAGILRARGAGTEASAIDDLRDALLPAGMAPVNWSYVEEAAEADRVEGRLLPRHRDIMARTSVLGVAFDALVGEWQASARELGEADRARTDIEADMIEVRAPALSRTRRRWMDLIQAMRAAGALLDAGEQARIFRKLDESEARADARVAARRAAGATSPEGDVDGTMPLDGSDVRAPEGAEDEGPAEPEAEAAGPDVEAAGPGAAPGAEAAGPDAEAAEPDAGAGSRLRPIPVPGSSSQGDSEPRG